ncbi:T9SS type A sorting domain-containing protein [Flavobacterium sp.]|jgi:hypothetical protein|uniref:T9SS type A sorting domain-containing protein n=1 Tax=Flavobacterium sp. TaxID=239 RepID=UPI0037BF1CFF
MKLKLLFITLLACFSGWGQVIIMSEDFSSITAGNNTSTSGSSSTWTGNTNFPTVVSAYQSGGSVKIGASAAIGSITSKPLDLSVNGGNFTLNFEVKGWTTVEGSIKITITNQIVQTITYTAAIASTNFETKTLNFTGGVSNSTIKIETTAKRAFLDNIVVSYLASTPTSTTYTTSWSNSAPTATTDAIIDGDLTTTTDLTCKDLTINSGKTLTIGAGKKLTVSGNLINNGTIIFKSDVNGTAMFDVFNGTQSGTGVVTTERYIPAKRAFRFLSPSVTTTTSIKLNWQENAGTSAGLGTHITGFDGTTNGFDATATNNPSLFTFDNSTGAWEAVTSSLTNNLTAGTPYRLMVRGDRLIDLTTNTPTASPTILRASGTLKTGSFSPTLNQAAEGFSFVGNPYQAPVDIKAVLNAATNMNTGLAYYWDPTLNARGGYVARNLTTNSNDVTSNFNEFLQPGQAVFVKKANTASAASVTIIESHKTVPNAAAGVFRNANTTDYGLLRVNLQANTNNQWQTIEGTLAIFNSDFNTAVTEEDATKMANLDEEVSFVQNNTSLAIACQPNPTIASELPIRLTNTRYTNYQWQFELSNYSGPTPFLVDTQNNSITQITNTTVVPFTTDSNANRFKIVFQNAVLSTDTFASQVGLYPNPSKGNGFYLQLPSSAQATVRLYNTLGQEIAISHNEGHYQANQSLAAGVYHIMVTQGEKTSKLKWIVE